MTLPTITVADFALPVQTWVGPSEPTPNGIQRPCRTHGPRAKPSNGFFTCVWNSEGRTTPWLNRLHNTHSKRVPDDEKRQLWTLVPDESAQLYVIDGLEAFEKLVME